MVAEAGVLLFLLPRLISPSTTRSSCSPLDARRVLAARRSLAARRMLAVLAVSSRRWLDPIPDTFWTP